MVTVKCPMLGTVARNYVPQISQTLEPSRYECLQSLNLLEKFQGRDAAKIKSSSQKVRMDGCGRNGCDFPNGND